MKSERPDVRVQLRRALAIVVLTAVYGCAWLVAKLFGHPSRKTTGARGRILVVGTFHNPNWYLAHISPLAGTGVVEVILVADGYVAPMDNVVHVEPAAWACRLFSRAGAKAIWAIRCAFRFRPDLYMGYAIFPGATLSLILGRLFRRPACFQLTSGKLELEGGGYAAENQLLSALAYPSAWIEKLAAAVTREMELIVVRGEQAAQYVRSLGFDGRVETVTGSVQVPATIEDRAQRPIDVLFVGRLTERKRPADFVDVVAGIRDRMHTVRAMVVGDGPDRELAESRARECGVAGSIEFAGVRSDVVDLLGRAKLFVLTSRWEGLSIAMMESMAAGCVPICTDVGDLRDLLVDGHNGYLLSIGDVPAFVERAVELLSDGSKWRQFSQRAHAVAAERVSREAVTARWRGIFVEFLGQSGE